MIWGARFLVNEVGEDLAAHGLIGGMGMQRRKICGKRGYVVIILGGVVAKGRRGKFAAGPALVERMKQEALARNLGVNLFEMGKRTGNHKQDFSISQETGSFIGESVPCVVEWGYSNDASFESQAQ